MGEYADMMLDGTLCQYCGVVLENSIEGIPGTCRDCRKQLKATSRNAKPFKCDTCGKRLTTEQGLTDHRRDAHGATA